MSSVQMRLELAVFFVVMKKPYEEQCDVSLTATGPKLLTSRIILSYRNIQERTEESATERGTDRQGRSHHTDLHGALQCSLASTRLLKKSLDSFCDGLPSLLALLACVRARLRSRADSSTFADLCSPDLEPCLGHITELRHSWQNSSPRQELFLTGDTSQTVSRAVEFRFCDLQSLG